MEIKCYICVLPSHYITIVFYYWSCYVKLRVQQLYVALFKCKISHKLLLKSVTASASSVYYYLSYFVQRLFNQYGWPGRLRITGCCGDIITRTSEWVITLWRSCELFLCRDISWVRRTSEISLPKTMNMISTDDHHELVLVFMPY